MFNSRTRREALRPTYPDHVVYAAYLYPLPAAFRMDLRGLSFDEVLTWRERYRGALPPRYQKALDDEYHYRHSRPQMQNGGRVDG